MNPYDHNPFAKARPSPRPRSHSEYDANKGLKEATELISAELKAVRRALSKH